MTPIGPSRWPSGVLGVGEDGLDGRRCRQEAAVLDLVAALSVIAKAVEEVVAV